MPSINWFPCNMCGSSTTIEEEYDLKAGVCYACSRYLSESDSESSKLSSYIKVVEKIWGKERWIANSPMYCCKMLDINHGYGTSIHHHKHKFETMTVIRGKFRIMLEDKVFFMDEGDILHISPYQVHKIDSVRRFLVDGKHNFSTMLEVSTQHFDDDSIRHGNNLMEYLEGQ